MDEKLKRVWYFNLILGVGLPLVLGAVMAWTTLVADGEGGLDVISWRGLRNDVIFILIAMFPVALVRLLYNAIRASIGKQKSAYRARATGSLLMAGMVVLAFKADVLLQARAIERNITAAEPIIAALDKYRAKNGTYPARLGELVPQFLPAVPSPAAAIFEQFTYETDSGGYKLYFGQPGFMLNLSEISYFSSEPCNPYAPCRAQSCRCFGKWIEQVLE